MGNGFLMKTLRRLVHAAVKVFFATKIVAGHALRASVLDGDPPVGTYTANPARVMAKRRFMMRRWTVAGRSKVCIMKSLAKSPAFFRVHGEIPCSCGFSRQLLELLLQTLGFQAVPVDTGRAFFSFRSSSKVADIASSPPATIKMPSLQVMSPLSMTSDSIIKRAEE